MNPEQNKQPNQVDQSPLPVPYNPTIISPSPEPVEQQPTPTPTVEPVAMPVSAPSITQPVLNPQLVTQPTAPQSTPKSTKKTFVIAGILVVVIILVISGFVAASVISSDKASNSDSSEQKTDDSQNTESNNSESETLFEDSPRSAETDTSTAPASSQALVLERDTERKNELKYAQQQLENYFNDNGEYPADWTVVIPDPDGRTGPNGDAYTYIVAADQQTYTLSANLENDSDPKADANGNYVIFSVNI